MGSHPFSRYGFRRLLTAGNSCVRIALLEIYFDQT